MPVLISVIIPAFKAEATLARAVESVARQTMQGQKIRDQVEVIIAADDGRDYGFAQSLAPRVKVLAAPGKGTGPGAARNRGIRASTGRYLAFLDADDHYGDGYFERALDARAAAWCGFRADPSDGERWHLPDHAWRGSILVDPA